MAYTKDANEEEVDSLVDVDEEQELSETEAFEKLNIF